MALRDEVEGDPVMDKAAGDLPYNLNLASGSECPVTAFPANSKGFHDAMGNVWQWLEDHFHPLPGSAVHPLYVDFSEPCYDGEHQMILGGSFISTGDEASKYARFHFRPHFFQHAGFRLSQSVDGPASGTPVYLKRDNASYDGEAMLNTYMLMHWGSEADIYDRSIFDTVERPNVVELPLACAQLLRKHSRQFGRALDLGCAVGRASFEMARDFQTVIGIDYSQNFVAAAQKLQEQGQLTYWRRDHGDSGAQITAQVDAAIDRSRLSFEQGDANALRSDIGTFDAVLMANLLCRLSNPQACLAQLQGANAIVNKGGIVVMTTPFSWFEHFTPRDRWLADVPAIAAILTEYELVEEQPLPFMIREHRRKFEYIITHASVWRRIP